jgi:transposase-like protein
MITTVLFLFVLAIVAMIAFHEFYHPDCPRCSSKETEKYIKGDFETETIWHCRYCNKTFKITDKQ